jgi:hypothetical protein
LLGCSGPASEHVEAVCCGSADGCGTRRVGALVDAAALQLSRTERHHLLWIVRCQELPARRVDEVLELVGLASAARRKAGGYSLGMRQRLGIAAACSAIRPARNVQCASPHVLGPSGGALHEVVSFLPFPCSPQGAELTCR